MSSLPNVTEFLLLLKLLARLRNFDKLTIQIVIFGSLKKYLLKDPTKNEYFKSYNTELQVYEGCHLSTP